MLKQESGKKNLDNIETIRHASSMRKGIFKYFEIAGRVAIAKDDIRQFLLGALAVRNDGKWVLSPNGPAISRTPQVHAEARLARKVDVGSVVYVCRVKAGCGLLGMARPCPDCQRLLKAKGVSKVYYSISDYEYGVIDFINSSERIVIRQNYSIH